MRSHREIIVRDLAPEPILEAAMHTLHMGMVYARNCTLQHTPDAAKQANDFMEALHEIPLMLTHWSRSSVEELRMHLGCYDQNRWNGVPNLVKMFDSKLAELSTVVFSSVSKSPVEHCPLSYRRGSLSSFHLFHRFHHTLSLSLFLFFLLGLLLHLLTPLLERKVVFGHRGTYGVDGSRCSDKWLWHASMYLENVKNKWVLKPGQTNEVKSGKGDTAGVPVPIKH